MAEKKRQTYENHSKFVPTYHFMSFLILVINLGWSVWKVIDEPSFSSVMRLLLAVALIEMLLHLRLFPLKAQDRVIRLEMRLRLQEILPEDLRPRINDLTPGQLVALRFAGDAEMPDLVRDVLDGKLADAKAIKQAIKDWQADYLRV